MYSKNELIGLGNLLKKYNHINIMSDDIYEKIIYDDNNVFILLQK